MEPAREKIRECRQILARANFQVGYFYQKTRKSWRSAIGRYETIVSEYPDFERFDEVLFRLAQCLAYAGRYAEARPPIGAPPGGVPAEPVRRRGEEARSHLPGRGRPRGGRARPRPRAAPAGQADQPAAEQSSTGRRLTSSVTLRICVKTS